MLELFLTFMKIGLFTFGGGYAMIALIERICVEQKKWISHDEMMNVTVIAESTPGPIAINCATFVGYLRGGMTGALAATAGVVLPSFAIIFIISKFLDHFLDIVLIANAFRGIRIAVGLLITNAALNMIRKMKKKPLSMGILAAACAAMLAINVLALDFSALSLMLLAGVFSLAVFAVRKKGGGV